MRCIRRVERGHTTNGPAKYRKGYAAGRQPTGGNTACGNVCSKRHGNRHVCVVSGGIGITRGRCVRKEPGRHVGNV